MTVTIKIRQPQNSYRPAYASTWSPEGAVSSIVRSLGTSAPNLIMLFCGGKHDPNVVFTEMRRAYPDTPIVGGSAAGAISRDGLGCSGFEVGALGIFGRDTSPTVVSVTGLDLGVQPAGVELGRRIAKVAHEGAPVFLFYDSVAGHNPLQLYPAATLISGLQQGLDGKRISLVGGGTLTDLNFNDGWVFDGCSVQRSCAVAVVFPPTVSLDTTIVHGCRPVSVFMEVTRVEGSKIYELDGQPALQVIESLLGLPIGGTSGQELSLIATLGQKQGDPYAPFNENAYVNRLILHADRTDGSINLFEPDFGKGAQVQIMSRDNDLMLASARKGVAELNRSIEGSVAQTAFVFYIDCAGRASALSGAMEEEADVVRKCVPLHVPFLGFYSGVEIAQFNGDARALDWSGVIARVSYS